MNTGNDNPLKNKAASSVTRLVVIALVFSVLGYLITQRILFDQQTQQSVIAQLQSIKEGLCGQGIRLPMIDCSKASPIKGNLQPNTDSYKRQFARLPNLSAAVGKLQWNNGTEADAVKLLTILNNLTLSRSRQSSENFRAIPAIVMLLQPVWKKYPDMVAAASCLYCGNSFNVLSKLIASNDTDIESLKRLAMGHPRMLREVASQNIFSPDELNHIVKIQAALSSAGDSGTAEFVGKILLQNQDYQRLRVWLTRGLNGSRALGNTDLDSLPFELVVAAWEQGVKLGYDQVKLSQYLVSKGYRPALRWVLWLQDSQLKYIRSWSFEREKDKYTSILKTYTDFPLKSGDELIKFYSDNWRKVNWDKNKKRWSSAS